MKNRFILISLILAITLTILGMASFAEAPQNTSGPGAPQGRPGGQQMPNIAAAAEQLGITEEALIDALGDPAQGPPDFASAADTLGITEADLLDALGITIEE